MPGPQSTGSSRRSRSCWLARRAPGMEEGEDASVGRQPRAQVLPPVERVHRLVPHHLRSAYGCVRPRRVQVGTWHASVLRHSLAARECTVACRGRLEGGRAELRARTGGGTRVAVGRRLFQQRRAAAAPGDALQAQEAHAEPLRQRAPGGRQQRVDEPQAPKPTRRQLQLLCWACYVDLGEGQASMDSMAK